MSKKNKMLAIALVVFMAVFAFAGTAMAATIEVQEGQHFDLAVNCSCADPQTWNVNIDSDAVQVLSYDYDCKTIGMYSNHEGRDTVSIYCDGCGARTNYGIRVTGSGQSEPLGLYIEDSNIHMTSGEGRQISAYWNDPAARTDLRWTSSDSSVVSISDSTGGSCWVNANGQGSAYVTVTDRISGESASCHVYVKGGEWTIRFDRQPSDQSYNYGDSPRPLSAHATAYREDGSPVDGGVTYQWYRGNRQNNINHKINGATDSTYYPDTDEVGDTYYVCIATYSVGSVDVQDNSYPACVTVRQERYGVYVVPDSNSIYAGDSVGITARIHDAYGNLVGGNYRVNWEVSDTRRGTMETYTTTSSNGRTSNILLTQMNTNNNTITVTAYVTIEGLTYRDSATINVKGVTERYTITLDSNKTSYMSGDMGSLTATVYRNGALYNNNNVNVVWTLRNANNYAGLTEATTRLTNGVAYNNLKVFSNTDATAVVVATATVNINGVEYTATKDMTVKCSKMPTSGIRMVMQIDNKNVVVNNGTIASDVAPVIVDGRTLVPIRIITENFHGTSDWYENTRTVVLHIDGKTLTMQIGTPLPGYGTAPMIINGRTFVPVRYVLEQLGANVEWIDSTRQIIITK